MTGIGVVSTTPDAASAPDSVDALLGLANLRAGKGDMASASALLRRAAAIEPALWTVWHSLGTVSRARRGDIFALVSQRRAYALGATGPLCLMQLTVLEAIDGHIEAARAQLAATLDAAPDLAKHLPNDVIMAAARAGRTLAAAILAEDLVARLPFLDGAAGALHFSRARLGKSASDVREVIRRWGDGNERAYHPVDADRRRRAPGYVLIRGWGTGFCAELFHVANNVAFAEIAGRIPFVYWGEEVRYRSRGCDNAWEQYFEPLAPVDRADLEAVANDAFPRSEAGKLFGSERYAHVKALMGNTQGIGPLATLNRHEALVVADGFVDIGDVLAWTPAGHRWASVSKLDVFREIFCDHFRLNPKLGDAVSDLAARMISGPTIAVHVRSQSQRKNQEALEGRPVLLEAYFAQADRWLADDPTTKLLLFTDSEGAVAAFVERYGRSRVGTLDRARVSMEQDGHAGRGLPPVSDVGLDSSLDGHLLGAEVLIDAYLAIRCERFIGDGASSVSCAIFNLKRWRDEDACLLRQHVYLERCHWKTPA